VDIIKGKELNILAVGDPAVYGYVDKKNDTLEQFTKQTGIAVNFEIIEWSKYYPALLKSFQEYNYDIVMVAGHLWLQEFVEKGYLQTLNGNFGDEYDYQDIMPSIRKELEFRGEKYLLPSFCDGHILTYRKSQLIKEPAELISIDELIAIVKNNKDDKKNAFVQKAHPSEIFLDFLPYLRSEGIDAFTKDGLPRFNNNAGLNALQKYIEMKQYCATDVKDYGNEEVLNAIQRDKCKLGISWGGQIGQIMNKNCINPDDIEFSYLETSWNTTWSFAINHLCPKPVQAEIFLKYITSKEIDKAVGAYCGNPSRKSSFLAGKDEFRWYPVLYKMLERAEPLPQMSNTGQMIGIISDEIVKAYQGNLSPKKALENAYQKILSLK